MVRNDTFQNGSFKYPVQLPLIGIEVIGCHRIALTGQLRLLILRPPERLLLFWLLLHRELTLPQTSDAAFGVISSRSPNTAAD